MFRCDQCDSSGSCFRLTFKNGEVEEHVVPIFIYNVSAVSEPGLCRQHVGRGRNIQVLRPEQPCQGLKS